MENKRRWVALYSQTGSELRDVSRALDRYPDVIITNKYWSKDGNPLLPDLFSFPLLDNGHQNCLYCMKPKPTVESYRQIFQRDDLITLHGWLRIIPPEICKQFEIYNGHPGLITEHPELKGKDPQKKAHELGLPMSGCVIHRVTPEVDSGDIMALKAIVIQNLTLAETIERLHNTSINLWVDFLRRCL